MPRREPPFTLVLAIFALGIAMLVYNSTASRPVLTDLALVPLTASIFLCAAAAMGRSPAWLERRREHLLPRLILLQILTLTFDLGKEPTTRLQQLVIFAALSVIAIALYRGIQRWFPGVLAVFLLLGVLVIRSSPNPHIDVFYFQQISASALLHGHNPYTATFPNLYGAGTTFYPPGFLVNDRVTSGFVYPPLSLLLSLPGCLLGDCRYSQLAALLLTALLLRAIAGEFPALLFLTQPRIFLVLHNAYTEPFVVLLLALTAYAAQRLPRAAPYAAGFLFAVKQYLILGLPAALLLLPKRGRVRFAALAVCAAAAVTLPFLLWNPQAFWCATVQFNIGVPFRPDSLSYPALLFRHFHFLPPFWPAFLLLAAAQALVLRRGGSFPLALGFSLLLFFPFGPAAFQNYYFCILGALCIATAPFLCHNREI